MISELRLTKTFTLRQGDRALHLKVEITNNGSKGKRSAYWFQSALDFDGERKHDLYWRPARHAVDRIRQVSVAGIGAMLGDLGQEMLADFAKAGGASSFSPAIARMPRPGSPTPTSPR